MELGFETIGLALFALLSILPVVPPVVFMVRLLLGRKLEHRKTLWKKLLVSTALAAAIYLAVCADAYLFEPEHPVLEQVVLEGAVSTPLTLLHLSDLHIETDFPKREAWLLEQLEALAPDLILITGDLHQTENFDPGALERVLGRINAPLGVYACVGFDNVSLLESAAPQIKMLINETVTLEHGGGDIAVCGFTEVGKRDALYTGMENAAYTIVMNHTPDLADEAAAQGINLYLCGHTHGGQVRIPFWGALITNCDSGKKYEGGWYQSGDTAIHTSRGLGLEPRPAPQVRFFCRPEITLITVNPK